MNSAVSTNAAAGYYLSNGEGHFRERSLTMRHACGLVLALVALWVLGCGDGDSDDEQAKARPPAAATTTADGEAIVDIPRLTGMTVNADAADWGPRGFRVGWLTHARFAGGDLEGAAEFDPTFRLGWTPRGLVALIVMRDDQLLPALNDQELWANKADVAILYLIPERGGDTFTRIAIAPNLSDVKLAKWAGSEPRVLVSVDATQANREESPSPFRAVDPDSDQPDVQVSRQAIDGGVVLEVLVPWSTVGLTGKAGDTFGFQMAFVDCDLKVTGGLAQGGAMWHPAMGTSSDTKRSHIVRLSGRTSRPQLGAVSAGDDLRRVEISIEGASELAGKGAEVRVGNKVRASGTLTPGESGWPFARLSFEAPMWERTFDEVAVFVDGRSFAVAKLPDPARRMAETMVFADVEFDRYCLFESEFPKPQFENPELIEAIIGPYELTTTFYDPDYNEVAKPIRPGRYGAVVEVQPETGRPFKRFVTLFRVPDEPGLDRSRGIEIAAAEWLGASPQVATIQQDAIHDFVRGHLWDALVYESAGAILMAGLHETGPAAKPDDFYGEPERLDIAWWLGLKRKLYGWDTRWPDPFVCPRPIEGAPATVVHTGTLAEAGMKPDTVTKLDALLTEWAENSDEAFAVCIVRRGVIVLHKAYGWRDGQAMTVVTNSWMASTTKMLSGTLLMMLVDQGLMDMADPIQDYLPALAGIETNQPLTIRRLHNHTNDFDWHFGNGFVDMDERIAILLPHLNVGAEYRYEGTGMELNTKAIEAISGESLPQFYKNHLLDPLGCGHTSVSGASGDADSVPLDMARIAQMLLNKGAYGHMRFFSEETFEQMLPQPVALVDGESGTKYGVGMIWVDRPGLSAEAFTHGAASSATTWIDPANELVICMTRNDAGENFYQYHTQFAQLVTDSMIDPAEGAGEGESDQ